jgi:hypothetical protein
MLSRSEASLWVERGVKEGGHLALFDLFPYFFHHIDLIFGVIPIPSGKIHMLPGLFDVVFDEPGNRGDVSIPGPYALVRMAVVASALKNSANVFWRRNFSFDRWVFAVDGNELNRENNASDAG